MKPSFEMDKNAVNESLTFKLLKDLIDNSYDGITVVDPTGKVILYSKASLSIFGLTPKQVEECTIYEMAEKGWILNTAGKEALNTSTPVMDDNNQLIYVISNMRDITELNTTSALYRKTLQQVEATHFNGHQIVYRSSLMENLISLARKFSEVDTSVLILGESGVGKDVLANYIHHLSDRKNKGPFVKINCRSIPEHLLESELFGYEAGAFTGALKNGKLGLFETANNGTSF